jgi:hypothetical protein
MSFLQSLIELNLVNPLEFPGCHVFVVGDVEDVLLGRSPGAAVTGVTDLRVAQCVSAENSHHLEKQNKNGKN